MLIDEYYRKLTLNEWYSYMGVRMGGSIEDRLRASFNMFDRNHDGELTRSELVEVISLVEFHKQYYEQLCTGRILNNAGKIRLREKTDKIATDTVNRLFQKADADNSNTINVDEFVAGFLQDSESMSVLNLFQKGN
jgi:Ca2+-binding EF-hand superfamily protein